MTAIPANVTGTAVYASGMVLRMNEPGAACSFDAFCKEPHVRLKNPQRFGFVATRDGTTVIVIGQNDHWPADKAGV